MVRNSQPWSGIHDQKQKLILVQKISSHGWGFPAKKSRPWLGIPNCGWEFPTVVGNSRPKAKIDFGAKNQFAWLGIPDQRFPTVAGNSQLWLGSWEFPTVAGNSRPKAKIDFRAKNQFAFAWSGIFPTVVMNSRRPWLGIPDCGREFPTKSKK